VALVVAGICFITIMLAFVVRENEEENKIEPGILLISR